MAAPSSIGLSGWILV